MDTMPLEGIICLHVGNISLYNFSFSTDKFIFKVGERMKSENVWIRI
jgi:hypothetical protein